tara:strand:- start:373 stop:696 length:324 start_codon:yes stop_codon:yes gene_type:complete
MFIDIQHNRFHLKIFQYIDYLEYINLTMTFKLKLQNQLPETITSRLENEKKMYKMAYYFIMGEKFAKERDDYHKENGYQCVCNKNYDGGQFCTYCRESALCMCLYCQ